MDPFGLFVFVVVVVAAVVPIYLNAIFYGKNIRPQEGK